jgi:hypothetical protein
MFVFIYPFITNAQTEKLSFTQYKPTEEGYVVYFHLTNIQSEAMGNSLAYLLIKDENIISARYFKGSNGKDRFQLIIKDIVTPEYIRDLVNPFGVDFDFSTIAINGIIKNQPLKSDVGFNESPRLVIDKEEFPVYEDTGNKTADEQRYIQNKKQWVENNPEKYEELLRNQ